MDVKRFCVIYANFGDICWRIEEKLVENGVTRERGVSIPPDLPSPLFPRTSHFSESCTRVNYKVIDKKGRNDI